jgi:hypothetical protein
MRAPDIFLRVGIARGGKRSVLKKEEGRPLSVAPFAKNSKP